MAVDAGAPSSVAELPALTTSKPPLLFKYWAALCTEALL
jgi:hypothetical protein